MAEKVQSGKLTLSNIAKARQAIRTYEKITGEVLSAEHQAEVLSHLEGKTCAEAEQKLFSIFPETSKVRRESKKRVSEDMTQYTINLNNQAVADLEQVQNSLSHAIPDREPGKVIARVLREYCKREDLRDERAIQREKAARAKAAQSARQSGPRSRNESPRTGHAAQTPVTQTVIGAEIRSGNPVTQKAAINKAISKSRVRRVVIKLANRRCEFQNPKTGKVCGSAVWIEADHIDPKALGGQDDLENRRCLCRAHNQFEGKRKLNNLYSWD